MSDFVEVNTTKTFSIFFLDNSTGTPFDPTNPQISIGFYDGVSFVEVFNSPLISKPGSVGEFYKEVFIDPDVYAVNQFFYVRYTGLNSNTSQNVLLEGSFRTIESTFGEDKNTVAFLYSIDKTPTIPAEFYISPNSEINSRRAFLRGELLGPKDLWIEILDINTNGPRDPYKVRFSIEDLTDCRGICNSEGGAMMVSECLIPEHCGPGKFYAEWRVRADANPGAYMIHWDIQYTSSSPGTRISQNFHITAKKNMYDLNFQDPFSPTAAN